ncbi:MAG: hypothetical protein M1818_002481 [Claussenomyces sp. TS43310]|nr:MAG: hypothetical protein M1818_002481 [Claussenomyces sp. TS43310]
MLPDTDAVTGSVNETTTLPQRSRAGCQQCRRRRRKCDEQRLCCSGCLERNLICNWQRGMTNDARVSRRKPKYNKDFALPHEMGPLTTVFAAPPGPIVQRLVSHFCVTSPLWLTIGGNKNVATCLRLVMPALKRSPLVLDCVLAVAAGDLSKYQPASSDMTNLSYGFYGQAVTGLQSALKRESRSATSFIHSDDTLLAIILLCVHEAVNFTHSDRMFPHINAAAVMCYNRSFSVAEDPPLRGLLFEIFCYIFTLTAFSHGRNLQLPLALQVFNSPFLLGSQYQGVLLGVSLELFSMILRVSILTSKITFPSLLNAATSTELEHIETQLRNWQLPRPADDTNDQPAVDESITSELYRLACLIHVKRIRRPDLALQSSEIQGLLLKFIAGLNTLPPTSPANGILCWPLVVAGMCAVVISHRRLIVGRLRKNHETWRSDILSKSADLLCREWREDKPAGGCWSRNVEGECLITPEAAMHPFEFPIILV